MSKIPKEAKKVFEGIIFDTYQWQQKMFDGSFATFEKLQRPGTLQVIPIIEDKILLAHEEQPTKPLFYTLFGGRQENEENPLTGVKREFLEETGMIANEWELFATYEPYTKIDWHVYTYIARGCKKIKDHQQESGERIQEKLVDFDEFVDIVTSKKFFGKELALDVLRMIKNGTLEELKNKLFKK